MEIINYDNSLSNEIRLISAECFLNSAFYSFYKAQGAAGKQKLSAMFANSMSLCARIGTAKCATVNDEVVGFIMGFDYHTIKKQYPAEFRYFFVDENIDEQNALLSEDFLQLDNIASKYPDCAYLMCIAVKIKYRRKGIAGELIRSFLNTYPGHSIITDVVSPDMENLCKNLGFNKINNAMPDCSVYAIEKRP